MEQDFKNKEGDLESVNSRGTELVEGCKDELSGTSGRIKLSDLNESWGDALTALSQREEKLKQGLALAENYQVNNTLCAVKPPILVNYTQPTILVHLLLFLVSHSLCMMGLMVGWASVRRDWLDP